MAKKIAEDDMKTTNTENTEIDTKTETIDEQYSLRDKFKEIVKEGSGLTILKILATALTAVSMSLISANLTGVINSLMLVALVSVGTAIVSEFYRILLSVTSLGAKKVVSPVIQVKTVKEGNTVRTVTEEVIALDESEVETVASEKNEEVEAENRIHELEQKVVDTGKGRRKLVIAKVHQRFGEYFKKNPFMKFVVLFAGIAMLTIGTSYLVSEKNQNTDNIFTTVYKTEETKDTLSEAEKQEIIEEAVKQAQENTPERTIVEKETEVQVPADNEGTETETKDNSSTSSADNSENSSNSQNGTDNQDTQKNDNGSVSSNSDTGSNSASAASEDTVKELEDRVKQLETDNENLRKELTTLKSNQDSSTASENSSNSPTVEELEEQIKSLQEQIDTLTESSSTSQSTAQPSVSPNNAPQGTTTD